jgi:hypothetical protein
MIVEIDATLFDRIERYLESQLPDPEAAAILQALEDAEIERTARALRERFVISEPCGDWDVEEELKPLDLTADGFTIPDGGDR